MNQNSTNATDLSNRSNETKRTNEITRESHLDRAHEILYLLASLRGSARRHHNEREVKRLSEQTASLRWLTEREKPPPWKAATEKAFAELATLEKNWDTYGGLPIDPDHIRAARFILDNVMVNDSLPPSVAPTSKGGVQLEWSGGGMEVEIETCEETETGERTGLLHCVILYQPDAYPEHWEEGVLGFDDLGRAKWFLSQMSKRARR